MVKPFMKAMEKMAAATAARVATDAATAAAQEEEDAAATAIAADVSGLSTVNCLSALPCSPLCLLACLDASVAWPMMLPCNNRFCSLIGALYTTLAALAKDCVSQGSCCLRLLFYCVIAYIYKVLLLFKLRGSLLLTPMAPFLFLCPGGEAQSCDGSPSRAGPGQEGENGC